MPRILLRVSVLTLACAAGIAVPADEPQWGSLSGRIVFDGEAPESELLDITRDEEFCGQHDLRDESLMIHPENNGLKWVVIWLDTRESIPVHPDAAALPEKPPALDNRDCRFVPRVLPVRTGQEFEISNSDPIAHNAAVFARRNQPFSIVIAQNEPLARSFPRTETAPVRVECSIHAWMRAWMVVTEHPYVVVTDENGRFELKHVPAGTWKFRFWHERPENLKRLHVNDVPVELDRGTWEVTVPAGEAVELGDVRVSPDEFRDDL